MHKLEKKIEVTEKQYFGRKQMIAIAVIVLDLTVSVI